MSASNNATLRRPRLPQTFPRIWWIARTTGTGPAPPPVPRVVRGPVHAGHLRDVRPRPHRPQILHPRPVRGGRGGRRRIPRANPRGDGTPLQWAAPTPEPPCAPPHDTTPRRRVSCSHRGRLHDGASKSGHARTKIALFRPTLPLLPLEPVLQDPVSLFFTRRGPPSHTCSLPPGVRFKKKQISPFRK